MFSLCMEIACPNTLALVKYFFGKNSIELVMQFLLDCSTIPEAIRCAQDHGCCIYDNLFYLSRTWCFAHHRERLKRLGKWKFR